MTVLSSSSWRNGRRTAAALGAVSAGLLALSACEAPTPLATVTVGQETITAEASCYDDGKAMGSLTAGSKADQAKFEKCLTTEPEHTIEVPPGTKARLGVEPDMAEQGWLALSNGMPLNSLSKQTYASIETDQLFYNQQTRQMQDETTVSILTSKGGEYTGVWNVTLKRADR